MKDPVSSRFLIRNKQTNKQTLTSYGLQCCSYTQQEWSNWILPLNFAHSENFKNVCLKDQNSNKLSCYISAINYGPTRIVLTSAVGGWSSYSRLMVLQWFPFPLLLAWRADYDKFNDNVRQAVGWFKCLYAGTEEETKIFFYDLLKVISAGCQNLLPLHDKRIISALSSSRSRRPSTYVPLIIIVIINAASRLCLLRL